MSLPSDIPPIPSPPPMVTISQALFERMAAAYWGTRGEPSGAREALAEQEEGPRVFDPERAGAIVFPDVHPGWKPIGRNATKPKEVSGG